MSSKEQFDILGKYHEFLLSEYQHKAGVETA